LIIVIDGGWMNWTKVEAYFGIYIGLIFIIIGFWLMASGFGFEDFSDPDVCYLGLIIFGIIALIFGLYDYNRLNKK
jgi:hypothetical protein